MACVMAAVPVTPSVPQQFTTFPNPFGGIGVSLLTQKIVGVDQLGRGEQDCQPIIEGYLHEIAAAIVDNDAIDSNSKNPVK